MTAGTPTNWIAITGAPSSGKTSVLNALEKRGHKICHEAARELIEARLAQGQTLEQVRADAKGLQREILRIKMEWTQRFSPGDLVFFDRGIPDSLSYFRAAGLDPQEIMPLATRFRYARVFLFERLPIVRDGVRTESEADARQIEDFLVRDYTALGYDLVRVPVMPVEERADFLLNTLNPGKTASTV